MIKNVVEFGPIWDIDSESYSPILDVNIAWKDS